MYLCWSCFLHMHSLIFNFLGKQFQVCWRFKSSGKLHHIEPVSYSRRCESSSIPLWQPQILQCMFCEMCSMFSKIYHYLRFEFSQWWVWKLWCPVVWCLVTLKTETAGSSKMLVSMSQNTQFYVPKYHKVYMTVCIFRRQHQDSLVWRMTWSSQEQAQGAIQMTKTSVLQCLIVGQVITFSTFYMMVKSGPTQNILIFLVCTVSQWQMSLCYLVYPLDQPQIYSRHVVCLLDQMHACICSCRVLDTLVSYSYVCTLYHLICILANPKCTHFWFVFFFALRFSRAVVGFRSTYWSETKQLDKNYVY
jgi:hypothetical protein